MFRKRHVQIGPEVVTMAPGEALSFYVKDRHAHGVLGSRASRRGNSQPVEERSVWLEFYHRSSYSVTLHNGNCQLRARPRRRVPLLLTQHLVRWPWTLPRSRIYSAHC